MLQIHTSQLEALHEAGLERFFQTEVKRLNRAKPSGTAVNGKIIDLEWVKANHTEALAYGMYSEDDHMRYNNIACVNRSKFPDEEALSLLQDPMLESDEKLNALEFRFFGPESPQLL